VASLIPVPVPRIWQPRTVRSPPSTAIPDIRAASIVTSVSVITAVPATDTPFSGVSLTVPPRRVPWHEPRTCTAV
jgi:hypothetical protein